MGDARSTIAGARDKMLETDAATLVSAILEGDPSAVWAAWHRFAPKVRRTLQRIMGNGAELDDLLQEVFVCFFRRLPTLQDPRAINAFVISITLNIARTELRRQTVRRALWQGWGSPSWMEPDPEAREALAHLCAILEDLGPSDVTPFMLRFVDNRDLAEVASILGVSLSTAKRRLARAWHRVTVQVQRDPALSSYLLRSRWARSRAGVRDSLVAQELDAKSGIGGA